MRTYMNMQQAFDTAYAAIITQGRPSIRESDGMCLYRSSDGARCAIGHLIQDADYHPGLEGEKPRYLGNALPILAVGNPSFWDDLQHAHDAPARECAGDHVLFIERFREEMACLARRYNLRVEG